ncbi:hypothetical protein DFR42_101723 [Undibacterium pigrum]|uniref:Uncharacterized protein n=1 Tax=Undibacterium pigrum TaxID=401470 RepID=A0A318JF52_9BURK|nr:hypothetical protein DFR42_101723 [Undibacterium pigrum]
MHVITVNIRDLYSVRVQRITKSSFVEVTFHVMLHFKLFDVG